MEILVIQDKILAATKQNLVKRNFVYINMFDNQVPAMVHVMRDLSSRVFEYLEITSPLDVDKRVNYTQRLLRVLGLKKYNTILVE